MDEPPDPDREAGEEPVQPRPTSGVRRRPGFFRGVPYPIQAVLGFIAFWWVGPAAILQQLSTTYPMSPLTAMLFFGTVLSAIAVLLFRWWGFVVGFFAGLGLMVLSEGLQSGF
jgi:hypothetical protein